jgi:hypothetical protein
MPNATSPSNTNQPKQWVTQKIQATKQQWENKHHKARHAQIVQAKKVRQSELIAIFFLFIRTFARKFVVFFHILHNTKCFNKGAT